MRRLQLISNIFWLLVLGSFTTPQFAQATVKITAVNGASHEVLPGQTTSPTATPSPTAGTGKTEIYGGTAGVFTGLGTNSTNKTFDTCLWATPAIPLLACNNRAIDANVYLTITYTSDKAGYPVLINSGSGTATSVTPTNWPTAPVAAGATGSITFRWGDVCASMATTASGGVSIGNDCQVAPDTTAATQTFTLGILTVGSTATTADADAGASIGIWVSNGIGQSDVGQLGDGSSTVGLCEDAGASGLCAFAIGNGDGKVVLRNLVPGLNFPTGGPLPAFAVRLLWAPGRDTFNQITTAVGPDRYRDLDLDQTSGASPSVSPSRVTGFTNDEWYSFKVAVVDMAQNVGYYTATGTVPGPTNPDTYCLNSTGASDLTCHLGHPGEVVGVLSKDLTCFVATAAYGSQMAPQVETFRLFRDQFLYASKWGVKFVKLYYKHSPQYARMIAQSETLRALARAALLPALIFAWLSVKLGLAIALVLSLLGIAALGLLSFAAVSIIRDRRRTREARCQSAT